MFVHDADEGDVMGADMIRVNIRGLEAKPLSGVAGIRQPATYQLSFSLKGSEKQRSAPENTLFNPFNVKLFHPPLINMTPNIQCFFLVQSFTSKQL